MIKLYNITKSILGNPLFEEVSSVLNQGDRVGIVGPNGCGKSTLLKIICGEQEVDEGDIKIEHERIGYLPQNFEFTPKATIGDFLGGYPSQARLAMIDKVGLSRFGEQFEISALSGGQKTRLAIAKMLIEGPTAMLLDEPTNHLDINGIEWLEKLIQGFKGIVVIVSHDRKLLNNSVNKILEIDPINHNFSAYIGDYDNYIEERAGRMEIQEEQYLRQQKDKNKMEQWLVLKRQEASIYDSPAKGKQIRAMEKRLEREIYSKEIKNPEDFKKIKEMSFSGETASPKLIVRCDKVNKSFGDNLLLQNISFEIRGKERVLLSGENGSGKTTLLKIISGKIAPDSGQVKIGEGVLIGEFNQEHEGLSLNKTVLDEFLSTDRVTTDRHYAQDILASFLFTGNSIDKKVADLSTGERVRLIFAKLTCQKNELLILDEPTNHLDIISREIIEKSLNDYKGALLMVSHDRYFIEKASVTKTLQLTKSLPKAKYNSNIR